MPTKRLQVQVSMCPAERKACDELLEAAQCRFGWARISGKPNRSKILNWLIKEELRKWRADPRLSLYFCDAKQSQPSPETTPDSSH